jgi:hypothetical protein
MADRRDGANEDRLKFSDKGVEVFSDRAGTWCVDLRSSLSRLDGGGN